MAPPGSAELPRKVLLVIVIVPPFAFSIAPPANAELPRNAVPATTTVPPLLWSAPPAPPPADPAASVRPLRCSAAVGDTARMPLVRLPLTVTRPGPGPR